MKIKSSFEKHFDILFEGDLTMKNRDTSHWEKNQYTPALLLFAEALEEGTFHYSYESYKYFCNKGLLIYYLTLAFC